MAKIKRQPTPITRSAKVLSSSVNGEGITYTYNTYGDMTQASRNTTIENYTYDNLHRAVQKTVGDAQIDYTKGQMGTGQMGTDTGFGYNCITNKGEC